MNKAIIGTTALFGAVCLSGCSGSITGSIGNNPLQRAVNSGTQNARLLIRNNDIKRAQKLAKSDPGDTHISDRALDSLHSFLSKYYEKQYISFNKNVTVKDFQEYCAYHMKGMRLLDEQTCSETDKVASKEAAWKNPIIKRRRAEAKRQWIKDVKAGRKEIRGTTGAALYHHAEHNQRLAQFPMANGGDGQWYSLSVVIEKKVGDKYYALTGRNGGMIIRDPEYVSDNLRLNRRVRVVGKYTQNGEIPLRLGGSRTAVVLENAYIGK